MPSSTAATMQLLDSSIFDRLLCIGTLRFVSTQNNSNMGKMSCKEVWSRRSISLALLLFTFKTHQNSWATNESLGSTQATAQSRGTHGTGSETLTRNRLVTLRPGSEGEKGQKMGRRMVLIIINYDYCLTRSLCGVYVLCCLGLLKQILDVVWVMKMHNNHLKIRANNANMSGCCYDIGWVILKM